MKAAHGRVFKYGDNVDTDVIIPARYLNSSDPKELAIHCMEDIDKDFDYQFNTIYDYQDFADIDALIIEYGSLGMFLNEAEQKTSPEIRRYPKSHFGGALSEYTRDCDHYRQLPRHVLHRRASGPGSWLPGYYLPGRSKGKYRCEEREKAVLDVMRHYDIPFGEDRILYGNFSFECPKARSMSY